jgi:hypothetical protein
MVAALLPGPKSKALTQRAQRKEEKFRREKEGPLC